MENSILFSEKQRFTHWWLVLILGLVNFLILSILIVELTSKPIGGAKPISAQVVVFVSLLLIAIFSSIFLIQLQTTIKTDGIYVRFFPFQNNYRHIQWNELSKSYVRTYNPINEYGGWGYRLSIFDKGKAYNVAGNKGLQLEFNYVKKLLIGTQKPEAIQSALKKVTPIQRKQV
ncbi:MAG: hypothetical protein LH478_03915 [Chitinophagaceae bacterium]|nr:hypothetical protein [Chitinophagaceae bacterium]